MLCCVEEVADGTRSDLQAIATIYEHYVRTSVHTFDLTPPSEASWADWFSPFERDERHRLVVAREGRALAGYAYAGPYRDRAAYAPSVMTSVYVAPHRLGRGIGS